VNPAQGLDGFGIVQDAFGPLIQPIPGLRAIMLDSMNAPGVIDQELQVADPAVLSLEVRAGKHPLGGVGRAGRGPRDQAEKKKKSSHR